MFYMLLNRHKLKPYPKAKHNYKYGIVISARNEEKVIGYLLDSINAQTYDSSLIKTFVIADNCTDGTADIAKSKGAIVYERHDMNKVGKGYALDFLFKKLLNNGDDCDAYIVFDADNVIDKNFVYEINKVHNLGYKVITSYRNSKNYGSNWISAGYSLWFLRESRYLNHARMKLNSSCAISGTGFMLDKSIIKENNGWKHHLLTEDIEFSIDYVCHGGKIGFADKAILFDEQPTTFKQSWTQRMRWSKGFYQVVANYTPALVKGIFKYGFSCFDMLMTVFPALFVMLTSVVCVAAQLFNAIFIAQSFDMLASCFGTIFYYVASCYITLFLMGMITLVTEWKYIDCPKAKAVKYAFSFPIFQLSYIPISIVALFKKVEWSPIHHSVTKSVSQIGQVQ